MPILPGTALTAGGLLVRLLQQMGPKVLVWDGTTTGGSTTTAVDIALATIATANDDAQVIGAWWYGISGTAAGQERVLIAPYTAASGTATFSRSGTNPGADTGYLIARGVQPSRALRALQEAQRYQTQKRISLLPITGREVVIGSALPNNLDLFTTANVPDGLTLDSNSTFTMGTTVTLGGRRALRMVTDGTNAGFIRFAAPLWGRFQGKTVRLYAHLRTSIAARTTIQFDDGSTTATTDTATTANDWELLDLSQLMGAAATQAQFSVEVSAGAAVTVDLALWYAPEPFTREFRHAIDADRSIVLMGGLRLSAGSVVDTNPEAHTFPIPVADDAWGIFEDTDNTPRQLRMRINAGWMGRVLEYTAYKNHAELTGPTISFTGTPELILPRAKYILLNQTEAPDANGRKPLTAAALQEALDAERDLRVRIPTSYKSVQAQ